MFEKDNNNEDGYLLLESLTTLGVIVAVILVILPIILNWMVLRNDAKNEVEISRVFYEYSFDWDTKDSKNESYNNQFQIQSDDETLRVSTKEEVIEVKIHGYEFKK